MVVTRQWFLVELELGRGVKGRASGLRARGLSPRSVLILWSKASADVWRKVTSS